MGDFRLFRSFEWQISKLELAVCQKGYLSGGLLSDESGKLELGNWPLRWLIRRDGEGIHLCWFRCDLSRQEVFSRVSARGRIQLCRSAGREHV